jgi:poly-gamma-glutamate synthase PgsB/CapB
MQWVAERRLICSQIGVITNVREDHLDQMGPTLEQVAQTLALTIPVQGHLITSEKNFHGFLQKESARLDTVFHPVRSFFISAREMAGFTYPTFKENVACALKVCELLGVSREIALRGMQNAAPDPGVMRVYRLSYQGRSLFLVNAMAANDYTSTQQAWAVCQTLHPLTERHDLPVIGIVNHRADRMTRIRELAPLVQTIPFAQVVLIGQLGQYARRCMQRIGFDLSRVQDYSGMLQMDQLLEGICRSVTGDLLLFAFGNIKGPGTMLAEYFAQHGEEL